MGHTDKKVWTLGVHSSGAAVFQCLAAAVGLIRLGVNGCSLTANGWAPDARYPLQQQALCSPFSLTPFTAQIPTSSPERAKKKKNTHTREKVLAKPQSLADKTHRIKTTCELEFCRSFLQFSSSCCAEKWSEEKFPLRRWVIEVFACFNASCSCAKHGIYVLALPLMNMRPGWKLSQWILPTAFQTELLIYGINSLPDWIYFT